MTTAHRPTWKPAMGRDDDGGGGGAPSALQSVLNMPAHTKLKVRTGSQLVGDRRAALRESLMKLEQAEARMAKTTDMIGRRQVHPEIEEEGRLRLLKQTAEVDEAKIRAKYDDEDEDDDDGKSDDGGWSDLDDDHGPGGGAATGGVGAVLDDDESDLDASDSDEDEDSDDEDEEAALQAELAKIRAEREAAKAKEEAEAKAEEEARMEEAALMGNPLLAGGGVGGSTTGRMKRRWNDDVVFRNQARGEPDQNKKRFINDTVRNDFHKRFLNKFIR